MPRALNLIRHSITRRPQFQAGLSAAGFDVVDRLPDPRPGDVVLSWNRNAGHDETCQVFEAAGAAVLVAENGYCGKQWMSAEWYAMALGHTAGAGSWPVDDGTRFDGIDAPLQPWRGEGETVILAQRSIGEPNVRSPVHWAESAQRRFGGRIRRHPGAEPARTALHDDLCQAGRVITWNSGAAIRALEWGVPVFYECPTWIGASAAAPVSEWPHARRDEAARLAMFQRLACAMWRVPEIESGEAFRRLLK